MATPTLKGNLVNLMGMIPEIGDQAKNFTAIKQDLTEFTLDDYHGKKKILNISPSIDTEVCANSVRIFNQKIANLDNVVVIYLSMDLPFAHKRFCAGEGIKNVVTGSLFRDSDFINNYGLLMMDSPLKGLLARAVLVLNENNQIIHLELVSEITNEPNYQAALDVI